MSGERKIVLRKVNDEYARGHGFITKENYGPSETLIISRKDDLGIGLFYEPGDDWYAFDKAISLGRLLFELGFTLADCEKAIAEWGGGPCPPDRDA